MSARSRWPVHDVSSLEARKNLCRPSSSSQGVCGSISVRAIFTSRAGLIARGRAAQWRPCRLEAGPLKGAVDWLERYRRFWDESFDRLDAYLREVQQQGKQDGRKK